MIDFLVDRKFGFNGKRADGAVIRFTAKRLSENNPDLTEKIAKYAKQLRSLPTDQLKNLCDTETKKYYEEKAAEAERQEQERFFNQTGASADFEHWSKAAHWTLDEAIALSFGKAPEMVTWEKVKPHLNISPFAIRYGRLRDLALRAVHWKQLFDPVLPGFFAAWAKRNDLPFPPELEAVLALRGVQVADWKSLHDDLERQLEASRKSERDLNEAMGSALKLIGELKSHNDQLMSENGQLADALGEVIKARDAAELRAAELQSKLDAGFVTEKPISPRERESLLKLVMGMAVACYKFDPKAPRSPASAAIVTDLEVIGIALDVDTVRKWLRAAAETVSVDKTE